jgi:hypothetical protein
MTELFDTDGGSDTGASTGTNTGGVGGAGGMGRSSSHGHLGGPSASKLGAESEHHQALLEYKLVLMNKQESLGLGLGHVRRRKYGNPVPIKTVGNKGSVELRGPAAVAPPSTAKRVAQGLMGAAGAVATAGTAMPAAAVSRIQQGLRGTPEKKPMYQTTTSGKSTTGADVVSTEPGTMLVRLSSTTSPRDRGQMRRTSTLRSTTSSLGDHHNTPTPKPVDDQDALEAFEAMQQVPAIIPTAAPTGSGGAGDGADGGAVGVGARSGGLPSVLPTSKSGRVTDNAIFETEEAAVEAVLEAETAATSAATAQLNKVVSIDTRRKLLQPLEGGESADIANQMIEEQGKQNCNLIFKVLNSFTCRFCKLIFIYSLFLLLVQCNDSSVLSRSRAKANVSLNSLSTLLLPLLIPSTHTPSSSL